MTIETLAARWPDLEIGTDPCVVGHNSQDPREWNIKPYVPVG